MAEEAGVAVIRRTADGRLFDQQLSDSVFVPLKAMFRKRQEATEEGLRITEWTWDWDRRTDFEGFSSYAGELFIPMRLKIEKDQQGKLIRVHGHWRRSLYTGNAGRVCKGTGLLGLLLAWDELPYQEEFVGVTVDGWEMYKGAVHIDDVEVIFTTERDANANPKEIWRGWSFLNSGEPISNQAKVAAPQTVPRPELISAKKMIDGEQVINQILDVHVDNPVSLWKITDGSRWKRVFAIKQASGRALSAWSFAHREYFLDISRDGTDSHFPMIDAAIRHSKRVMINEDIAAQLPLEVLDLQSPITWRLRYRAPDGTIIEGTAEDLREGEKELLRWRLRDIRIRWDRGASAHSLPVRVRAKVEYDRDDIRFGDGRIKDVTVYASEEGGALTETQRVQIMRWGLLLLWAVDHQVVSGKAKKTSFPDFSIENPIDYSRTVLRFARGSAVGGYTIDRLFPEYAESREVHLKWAGIYWPRDAVGEIWGYLKKNDGSWQMHFSQRGDFAWGGETLWIPPDSFAIGWPVWGRDARSGPDAEEPILEGVRVQPSTEDFVYACRVPLKRRLQARGLPVPSDEAEKWDPNRPEIIIIVRDPDDQ